jgi:hypothetical protein
LRIFNFDNIEKSICINWSIAFPLSRSSNLTIQNKPTLCISLSSSRDYEYCLTEKAETDRLISILSKKKFSFEKFMLIHKLGGEFIILGLEHLRSHDLNHNTISKLEDNKSCIFENWIDINKNIGFALENFFQAHLSRKMSLKNKFLAYCFSLELLHRVYFSKMEPLLKKHAEIITLISEVLKGKGQLETWFSRFANKEREISFKNRLEELILHSGISINIPEFANRVKDTRNKYVHLDDDYGNPFSDAEMRQHLHFLSDIFIEIVHKKLTSKP